MKARGNEEEETTSKIVSKNVTVGHDSTLEQRVDNLIAKFNSNPAPPNPINGSNNHNYGCPLPSLAPDPREIIDETLGIPLWISSKI